MAISHMVEIEHGLVGRQIFITSERPITGR
jgi:hypothetical protein